MANLLYFKASINKSVVYIETTEELMPTLFNHFYDNHYKVEELESNVYHEALRNGEIVYYARTKEIVDTFIENSNKIKEIKYGG